MKRLFVIILATSLLIGAFSFNSSAATKEDEIVPFYNNVMLEKTTFVIDTSGNATISLLYRGKSGVNSSCVIISKIQQNLSGTWVDININQPNNEWIDESTSSVFTKNHSVQLTSHGTYRAVVVYEISGTGGATDVIERIIEKTY